MLTLLEYWSETPIIIHILIILIVLVIAIVVFLITFTLVCYILSKAIVATAKEIMDYKADIQETLHSEENSME